MVAMGHGLCVSFWVRGEMTKNKVGPKKVQCYLELIGTRLQGVCMVIESSAETLEISDF